MNSTRKMHYAFTVLYGVAASVIVAASIIWINFWTTFQSGALALNVGIAFLLFATTIIGKLNIKTVEGEFVVYRKCAIIIGITCIIAMILSLFPLYNIVNILTKCPSYTTVAITPIIGMGMKSNDDDHHHHHGQPKTGRSIELVGNYDYTDREEKAQNTFYLTYDIESERVTRKQRIGNRWLQVETRDTELLSLDALIGQIPLDKRSNLSEYYFLEQEIKTILGENNYNLVHLAGEKHQGGFKSDSAYDEPKDKTATVNPIYIELMAQEICLYEYAFAIMWSIFIILLILLNIVTIGCYAWIKVT